MISVADRQAVCQWQSTVAVTDVLVRWLGAAVWRILNRWTGDTDSSLSAVQILKRKLSILRVVFRWCEIKYRYACLFQCACVRQQRPSVLYCNIVLCNSESGWNISVQRGRLRTQDEVKGSNTQTVKLTRQKSAEPSAVDNPSTGLCR
jgi:hypothetical protein